MNEIRPSQAGPEQTRPAETATGLLGTKTAAPVTAAPGGGGGSFLGTMGAIAIVLVLLKFLLPKMLAKAVSAPKGTPGLRIEDSTPIAGGHLHIVHARGRTLLLGATGTNLSLLADLTEATAAEPPTFSEIVEEAQPYRPASADLLERLNRLNPEGAR